MFLGHGEQKYDGRMMAKEASSLREAGKKGEGQERATNEVHPSKTCLQ